MPGLPDILFKGVPRRYTRGYTANVVKAVQPVTLCVPCAGAFALASTAAQAGVAPGVIHACDISLYTGVIGAYLAGEDIDVRPTEEWAWLGEYMTDPPGKVAAVTLAIRILQYNRDTLYHRDRRRELVENAPVYIEQARAQAAQMHALLGSIHYKAEDMWDLLARHKDDPGCLILCNPPRYTGGYDKMYEGIDDVFAWDAPAVAQFTEAEYQALMDMLGPAPALTLVYYATPVKSADNPADTFGGSWVNVFADRPKRGATAAINWILANRPLPKVLKRGDVAATPAPKYKLFTEGEITPGSDLRIVKEKREVVDYYRDLLVHRLGLVGTERYYVLLLDGMLLAAVGFHVANLRTSGGRDGVASLTFAFSPRHTQYKRLHKLVLMACVSSWAWEAEVRDIDPLPNGIQTTMLARHPEVKTARGIFKLETRERQSDGTYKLGYYADLVHRTARETIEAWLAKYG
jgi:hypothetical protein